MGIAALFGEVIMRTLKYAARMGLPALFVTVATAAAWADSSQNGLYVDHQQAADRGGVGNYVSPARHGRDALYDGINPIPDFG